MSEKINTLGYAAIMTVLIMVFAWIVLKSCAEEPLVIAEDEPYIETEYKWVEKMSEL